MDYLIQRLGLRKPVRDYSKFRISAINEPKYEHLKLLSGWIIYFALYFITENLIPVSACHVVHSAVDDMIPFNEYFLIFYCSWYALIVVSLGYFLLFDIQKFKELQVFIMFTQAIAMAVYIIYPSEQMMRPEVMPNSSFLCDLMSFIYAFDTPTGVCPSLHVAYSLGIGTVWCKYGRAPKWWKAVVVVQVFMICLSVMFVKQHSFIDVMAAIPLGILAYILVYGKHSIIQ
jgi:membrane-associated phospholipid phosphatase